MNSKEIITRVIERNDPPRIGLDFLDNSDIIGDSPVRLIYPYDPKLESWGRRPELLGRTNGFTGEVMLTYFGEIRGRFEGKTNGECVKGSLQDGWELLDSYILPAFDPSYDAELAQKHYKDSDKYIVANLPCAIFSPLRDGRLMPNALMDTLLEPENVARFLGMLVDFVNAAIRKAGEFGFDAVMFCDDLGTQATTFFSPEVFRELFKPSYAAVARQAHDLGLKVIMHCCGQIDAIIGDLIEAGIDVLQFDQPELYGSGYLARKYGGRVAFYCPVDIQKVMATGDRALIEKTAADMVDAFKASGGGLIAKDYPSWGDINVREEWAKWAQDAIERNAEIIPET